MAIEAELLCNVDEALTTPSGYTIKNPCGAIIGHCSYEDFSQWLAALRIRLTLAEKTYKYYEAYKKQKGEDLTEEQISYLTDIQNKKAIYETIRLGTGKDLDSEDYKIQIDEIIVLASDLNCTIEKIQNWIIADGGTVSPTGLIKGSRTGITKWEIMGYGIGGIVAIYLIKLALRD